MLRYQDEERRLALSVHDLVEAGPPAGHLSMAVAWSARQRLKAGQEAHSRWQGERGRESPAFRKEVSITHRLVVRAWEVTVHGRIDGLSEEGDLLVVEELKSSTLVAERLERLEVGDVPAWAEQLRIYLYLLGVGGQRCTGRLLVVSIIDGSMRRLEVGPDAEAARRIEERLDWLIYQRELHLAWRVRRRQSGVPFPHPALREGQERLCAELEEGLRQGGHLLLSAPTGYGKTAVALTAALRAAHASERRVFFATARGTQQHMAEQTLQAMRGRGLELRAVTLRAREKACLNEVVACRPESCSYAAGYHDRARELAVLERLYAPDGHPTADQLQGTGLESRLCPFALSLELAERADVIVGDYNYLFDPSARLALFAESPGEWIAVVDEAHNLHERLLSALSPELLMAPIAEGAEALRARGAAFRPYASLLDQIVDWLCPGVESVPDDALEGQVAVALDDLDRRGLGQLAEEIEGRAIEWTLLSSRSLDPGEPDPFVEGARALLRFKSAVERAGEETLLLWRRSPWWRAPARQLSLLSRPGRKAPPDRQSGARLLCRDPSASLGPVFGALGASLQMSATLDPPDFYAAMSGLSAPRLRVLQRPSPFDPAQRRVLVVPTVSTELRARERDLEPTLRLIEETVAAVPGNVAIYCPSHAWLETAAPLLRLGERPLLVQGRGMGEEERAALLGTLRRGEGHVLLAVLGGLFSEGVDLPGDGLLAAIVVGPALPQAGLERRLLQDWYQQRYQQGRRYAWLVPGMSRVVQAAGRVIRSPEDRGAIVLICRRFLLSEYQQLFPADWQPLRSSTPGEDLQGFWAKRGAHD